MKRLRVQMPGWLRTATTIAFTLMVAVTTGLPAGAAGVDDPLLRPTPLILKDGRIANVSVHVVPFAPGRSELGADTADRLIALTRAMGTDCFLTAQVIGHIDSDEVADDDTLNAHRLARSRADTVQATLIGSGLPAKSIASVWDWQFMVRDARATLWVFQLTRGEDCEGRPLGAAAVASNEATDAPTIVSAAAPAKPAGDDGAATAATMVAKPAAAATMPAPAPPAPAPKAASPDAPATARQASRTTVAGLPDATTSKTVSAATPTPVRSGAGAAQSKSVVISFPTNSSYFPDGTSQQLRELLSASNGALRQIVLKVAVSGSTEVVGANSPEEAARYNRWIAERRLERVRAWLEENLESNDVTIQQEFVANDDSRRVVVMLPAAG